MAEENKNEILQKLIYSAQNENKFTVMDLHDYLLSEHVDSEEEMAFYRDELAKRGLLVDEADNDDTDFIEEPTTDEIENLDDEGEDDLLADDEDDDMLGDDEASAIDLIEEPMRSSARQTRNPTMTMMKTRMRMTTSMRGIPTPRAS